MTDTPQVFDHDPRAPQGPQQHTKRTFHTDPANGREAIPGGGHRNKHRLSLAETLRRAEVANGVDPTDPDIIKAKALVDAVGAITHQGSLKARQDRHDAKIAGQRAEARDNLIRGAENREAQGDFRGRAAAERTIQASGAEPTPELMALFGYGPAEGPTPPSLQTGRRTGQEPLQAPRKPQDTLAMSVMAELAAERGRAALASGASSPDEAAIAEAMKVLEAAGLEVVEPIVVLDDPEGPEEPDVPTDLGGSSETAEGPSGTKSALGDPEE